MIIIDGALCHSDDMLNEYNNILLITLPPYCPQINPSENMWGDMREKFFPNLVFDSMDGVENKLEKACKFYENNQKIVKSITGFDWIIPHV